MKTKLTTIFMIGLISLSLNAQTPEERGLQIAQEASLSDEGFESSTVKLTMILTNKHGQESTRYMESKTLELLEDGDKSIIGENINE